MGREEGKSIVSQLEAVFTSFAGLVQTEIMGVLGPILGVVALVIAATLGIALFRYVVNKL